MDCDDAITDALKAGGAGKLLHALPEGLQTKLDYTGGYDGSPYHDSLYSSSRDTERRSLSGGEVSPIPLRMMIPPDQYSLVAEGCDRSRLHANDSRSLCV